MMEQLPADVMTRILEFVELPERLQLAMGSAILNKLIMRDCVTLWATIDFSCVSFKNTKRITDDMLAGFLNRVSAKDVTRNLVLKSCPSIQGQGLNPLHSSRVLERIDLRNEQGRASRNEGWDKSAVVAVLRTMIPHKLVQVKFNFPSDTPLIKKFLYNLCAGKHRQAMEQRVSCSSCRNKVMDEARQIVPNASGFPWTNCAQCHNQYCRTSACTMTVTDCLRCEAAYCGECTSFSTCENCDVSYCDDCCSRCYECESNFCSDCTPISYCHGCGCDLCFDCGFVSDPCRDCSRSFCILCIGISQCPDCEETLCQDCVDEGSILAHHCNNCGTWQCRRDWYACSLCDSRLCGVCDKTLACSICNEACCGDCGDYCKCCDRRICYKCTDFLDCDKCDESFCKDCHGRPCSSLCMEVICDDCAPNDGVSCVSCQKRICSGCVPDEDDSENEEEEAISECTLCCSPFCYECRQVVTCHHCNRKHCCICRESKQCLQTLCKMWHWHCDECKTTSTGVEERPTKRTRRF